MTSSHKLTRAAELETLAEFRAFIDQVCQANGIDPDVSFSLQLAVDEACANVIEHGYAGKDPGSVILQLFVHPGKVVVQLSDFGHPFEPSQAPTPDIEAPLEERELGGFGLFFIYSVMDNVEYRVDEDGNHLILTKNL